MKSDITRGISLYSLQEEYCLGALTLEGCLSAAHDLGIPGLEIVADQMIHGNPFPEEGFFEKWRAWMRRYRLEPVCDDIFINTSLYRNRRLTKKECVAALAAELRCAAAMGFNLVRLVSLTPPEIIEPSLPLAEKLGVRMALEIHAGMGFSHPESRRYIDLMVRLQSPLVGIVPDMGLFCARYPRVVSDFYLRRGANPKLVEHMLRGYEEHPAGGMAEDPGLSERFAMRGVDHEFAAMVGGFEKNDVAILKEYMPYIMNIHGKFYEMLEDGTEYSIPYDRIMALLKAEGYRGYICSEYEGNRFIHDAVKVDSIGQVRRHQAMMMKHIGA